MKKLFFIILFMFIIGCGTSIQPQSPVKIDHVATLVEATMQVIKTAPQIPTLEPTFIPEQIEVTFICNECVNEDSTILPITLWYSPYEMNPSGGVAIHNDRCLLLDEAKSSEGIEKVLLQCPGGKGWTRKEAINFN